jgi:mono/diheme cytochrome c family protein
MKDASTAWTSEELAAWSQDDRYAEKLLRDHIRAVAAGMRNLAAEVRVDRTAEEVRQMFREYADKLEGKL